MVAITLRVFQLDLCSSTPVCAVLVLGLIYAGILEFNLLIVKAWFSTLYVSWPCGTVLCIHQVPAVLWWRRSSPRHGCFSLWIFAPCLNKLYTDLYNCATLNISPNVCCGLAGHGLVKEMAKQGLWSSLTPSWPELLDFLGCVNVAKLRHLYLRRSWDGVWIATPLSRSLSGTHAFRCCLYFPD